ncbi:MAG: hypothetical protein AAFW68_04075 [Pseudomonadota bacterium]
MKESSAATANPFLKGVLEALLFVGLIILSSLAVIAFAIAAPFVLILSALAGLFSKGREGRAWRSVAA